MKLPRICAWATSFALVLTILTELYLVVFLLQPMAKKAALEESLAQANLRRRVAESQLAEAQQGIEAQRTELARLTASLGDIEAARARATRERGELELILAARRDNLSAKESLLDGSRLALMRADALLAQAQSSSERRYVTLRPLLANEVYEQMVHRCHDDERVNQAEAGTDDDGLLFTVFDDASSGLHTLDELQALTPVDRQKLIHAIASVRPRLESTRELIRARAQQMQKWKDTYSQIWKERGLPIDEDGKPQIDPSRSSLERRRLELQMLDIGAEVERRGVPLGDMGKIKGVFGELLRKELADAINRTFGWRSA